MIPTEVTQLLDRRFPFVRNLPQALRDSLLESARHVSINAGTTLFEDGNACKAFPLVLSGSVRVIKATSEGREMLLYQIEPGQFCLLTSSCLLGRSAYPASGLARTRSDVLLLPPSCFNELVNKDSNFRSIVFQLFSERLVELMQLVHEVAFQRLDQRLARLLLRHGNEIRSSHQALADELGSVRVIVSRLLRNFEEEGWVSLAREHVCILNPEALRHIANRNS